MPDLTFTVEDARPLTPAVSPHLAFKLAISTDARDSTADAIHCVMLQSQIRIEPARRRYNDEEQDGLFDLFGEPDRWGQTLRGMLWTHCAITVPAFTGRTTVDLPVPCTYDFNVAATKYFDALRDGEVPLDFLFSGTTFYSHDGMLRIAPIAWDKEASFRLPVQVWRRMMDQHYSNAAWLCLRKDVFERLYRYKSRRALPTWEQALDSLLAQAGEPTLR
ncbi:MAG TPA: DUF6084 family protein [Candidatus Binataceae bacterium]|nr:DUF6084 family protein [Candidatus Binataceae bacterium]